MSILKNNLRPSGYSVQSGVRSKNSKIINWVCATFLACLLLLGGTAKAAPAPYNVLNNPGAETAGLAGWNVSITGYIYEVTTNGTMAGVTNGIISTNQFLAHSGAATFQLFDTTANNAYIWQDYAAVAGSQWSANCYAICYASNYFDSAIAYMEVGFFDTNGNLLGASFDSGSGTCPAPFQEYGYGVYGSAILDPNALIVFGGPYDYIIVPPPANGPSGWMFLQATNFYYGYTNFGIADVPIEPGLCGFCAIEYGYQVTTPSVTTNLVAPVGTAFVRYKLEFDNGSTDGGDVYWDDCVLAKLTWSDPDITNPQPVGVTCYVGDPATFTVHAVQQVKPSIEFLEYQWQENGTNLPAVPGGDVVGNTTNTSLVFSACQGSDAGMYSCLVTAIKTNVTPWVTNGTIRTVPVPLAVLCFCPAPSCPGNSLGPNAGFETAPVWGRWNIFNGCYYAMNTNVYGTSTVTVNVFDGTWCALTGANGDRDNGLWQSVPCTPGSSWKAGAWAYVSSFNDFVGGNTARVQVWFKDANNNSLTGTGTPTILTYESFKIYGTAYTSNDMAYVCIDTSSPNYLQTVYHAQLPRDQWVYLPVTNIVNNAGISLEDDIPINTFPNGYFVVPTNSNIAQINYQIYEYCPQSSDTFTNGNGSVGPPEYHGVAADAVYWDDAELIQIPPVTNLTASVSGTDVDLTIYTGAGLVYTIFYKTNLTDPSWIVLSNNIIAPLSWQTNVLHPCDSSYPVTVTDPVNAAHSRFYRVMVQ
jgi:hypothetical protein